MIDVGSSPRTAQQQINTMFVRFASFHSPRKKKGGGGGITRVRNNMRELHANTSSEV